MKSISKHIDEFDIAEEVRLERKVHKGSFLLVEGITDLNRFSRFIDDQICSMVNCYGRPNAIGAIKLLYDEGFPGAVGIVDADFDRVTGNIESHEGLIYSVAHDLDLDWATPPVVARYLLEVAESEKVEVHGSSEAVIGKILWGLKPVSVARLLNHMGQIPFKLSGIDVGPFFSGFAVNLDAYVDKIFEGKVASVETKTNLKKGILRACSRDYDLRQISNGHDFHCALGASLRADLGKRRDVHTWGSEVEIHLRLAFDDTDFRGTEVFTLVQRWTNENEPYRIFHSRLS